MIPHLDDNAEEPERPAHEDVIPGGLRRGHGGVGEELPDGLDEGGEVGGGEGVRVAEGEELQDRADLGADLLKGSGSSVVVLSGSGSGLKCGRESQLGRDGKQDRARELNKTTYISLELRPLPPEVLSKQSRLSRTWISEEDGHVVFEELGKILGIEVVEELKEKEEGLGELGEGSCRGKLVNREREELVGAL